METDIRYPLHWPTGWPRTLRRQPARFSRDRTFATARDFVLAELRRFGASTLAVVLSSNLALRNDGLPRSGQAQPADPGIAVYFALKGRKMVLACDYWNRIEDNLYAIGLHIETMRAQQRYGVGTVEQAFAGYQALPARRTWWETLGVTQEATEAQIKEAFRRLAVAAHPDHGGNADQMAELNDARSQGLACAVTKQPQP